MIALTLRERVGDVMSPSTRQIIESPIEIGCTETVPYELFVPNSWGQAANPTIEPAHVISDGPTMQGARKILFAINAAHCWKPGEDCRLDISFDISDGRLDAWGIWQCRE